MFKTIAEEAVADNEIILIRHRKYIALKIQHNKTQKYAGSWRNIQGMRGRDTRETEVPTTGKPPRG